MRLNELLVEVLRLIRQRLNVNYETTTTIRLFIAILYNSLLEYS